MGGTIKWKDQSGKHYCVDVGSGDDVEEGSTMKLYSCKDSDTQHFDYDEFSNKFALDFDYEDDVDQLCMGWDDLENSSRVIATRCFEDRDRMMRRSIGRSSKRCRPPTESEQAETTNSFP